ncbi:MAG TPA: hypothetical protein VHC42_01770 [Rhizomicrobium sp.]|nr:hypothetical protein [Rhizomicrobium sp.]
MIACRISLAAALVAFAACAAMAQSDSQRATAPPRSLDAPLAGADQPPDVSTDELKDDSAPDARQDEGSARPKAGDEDDDSKSFMDDDLIDDYQPEQPAPAKGAAPPEQPAADVPEGPVAPKPEAVEVGSLGAPEGGDAGSLDAGNGGFESNMWNGSSRAEIESLLSRIPLASEDGAVRALARRVILTRADAPEGPGKRALISIRIEKLIGAGMIDEAGALAAQVRLGNDPDFARVQASALLVAGRDRDACSDLTGSRLSEGALFWLQLRAYCAAATGDPSTAELTRGVIEAQGKTDAAYDTLVEDALTGAKTPPGHIAKTSPVHLFLLRKAGIPVGADAVSAGGAAAAVLAMRDPRNPAKVRLDAAERALRAGAADYADLKAAIDAQSIPASEVAAAAAAARKLPFLEGQALLRRAAQLQSLPAEKAGLVHEALTLGDKAGLFDVAAHLQADVALSIDPTAAPPDTAPLIGWALLLTGRTEGAARWIGNDAAAASVLALASGDTGAALADLTAIAAKLAADPKQPDPNQPFEALTLGLYDALGRTLPVDAKTQAVAVAATRWPGRRPSPEAMQAMVKAAAAPDRKGEALLRILDIVGAKGPGDLAPDVTIEIVRALDEMGVKDAARDFALHAILLYRPPAA